MSGVGLHGISPVILCGGSGTRLWPLSRSEQPKQFLAIASDRTMLQCTAGRAGKDAGFGPPVIVAGSAHCAQIAEQLHACSAGEATVIVEPEGRNTAPAVALAAFFLAESDPEAVMLVMPSDHVITDEAAFHQAISRALPPARQGNLITFGIAASHAETGYGYIEVGPALDDAPGVHRVEAFVEKPNAATAQAYLEGGRHVWNGGIFLFSAKTYLAELRRHAPAIHEAVADAFRMSRRHGSEIHPDRAQFLTSPAISIDYAVMEKTDRAAVVPVEMGWSDVGSWEALWEISAKDRAGMAIRGDALCIDSSNSLVRVENGPMVAAIGVHDLIIVSTADAVLVLPRSRSQDVKLIVDELKARRDGRIVRHAALASHAAEQSLDRDKREGD